MPKVIYLLWDRTPHDPKARRIKLIDECAPKLLDAGAARLLINVQDDLMTTPSPAPQTIFTVPFVAEVSLWLGDVDTRFEYEDIMSAAGFDVAGYEVTEHLYTDYGGNQHSAPRDWPDGERSPMVVSVTPLERKKGMSKTDWMQHWFGYQGPMSEAMQPRARYVRNVVVRALTPGAPPYEGIVEESWPSHEHVVNPYLFYGAGNPLTLVKNMAVMTTSVAKFLPFWKITSRTMSEYWIQS